MFTKLMIMMKAANV